MHWFGLWWPVAQPEAIVLPSVLPCCSAAHCAKNATTSTGGQSVMDIQPDCVPPGQPDGLLLDPPLLTVFPPNHLLPHSAHAPAHPPTPTHQPTHPPPPTPPPSPAAAPSTTSRAPALPSGALSSTLARWVVFCGVAFSVLGCPCRGEGVILGRSWGAAAPTEVCRAAAAASEQPGVGHGRSRWDSHMHLCEPRPAPATTRAQTHPPPPTCTTH